MRSLWLVQRHGSPEALDPKNDRRVKAALSKALAQLSRAYQITGLFMYAVIVTIVAVLTVISLGRLAARIDAEPVEFKYPAAKKDS